MPTTEEFELMANSLARGYTPPIEACAECQCPVIYGYCCTYCGNSDPLLSFAEQDKES